MCHYETAVKVGNDERPQVELTPDALRKDRRYKITPRQ
jgi:hypothetical protein